MAYFIYPKGDSYDFKLAPLGPSLIAATTDLEKAIRIARANGATIEEWKHGAIPKAIEYDL